MRAILAGFSAVLAFGMFSEEHSTDAMVAKCRCPVKIVRASLNGDNNISGLRESHRSRPHLNFSAQFPAAPEPRRHGAWAMRPAYCYL